MEQVAKDDDGHDDNDNEYVGDADTDAGDDDYVTMAITMTMTMMLTMTILHMKGAASPGLGGGAGRKWFSFDDHHVVEGGGDYHYVEDGDDDHAVEDGDVDHYDKMAMMILMMTTNMMFLRLWTIAARDQCGSKRLLTFLSRFGSICCCCSF